MCPLGFMEALGSKRILNTLKNGITSAMECADVVGFTFATYMGQITLFFLCKFISAEATVINLFAILQVCPVGLGN